GELRRADEPPRCQDEPSRSAAEPSRPKELLHRLGVEPLEVPPVRRLPEGRPIGAGASEALLSHPPREASQGAPLSSPRTDGSPVEEPSSVDGQGSGRSAAGAGASRSSTSWPRSMPGKD